MAPTVAVASQSPGQLGGVFVMLIVNVVDGRTCAVSIAMQPFAFVTSTK